MDFQYQYRAVVKSVYDGDTVRLDVDLGLKVWVYNEPVRLYGINAPEMRGPERPDGIKARDFLRELIDGKTVTINTFEDKRGKYGRWLVRIHLDGVDVNRALVEAGHARWADY